MSNVMLIYPPGEIFQRGEDRCQSNIKSSTSTSMRACNDLGYSAAILRNTNNIFLKDYQTEELSYKEFEEDVLNFKPDFIFLSTTNGSIYEDIAVVNKIKKKYENCKIILKGAIFFDAPFELLEQIDLKNVDFLIGGEVEFCIKDIIDGDKKIEDIIGIFYKENGVWHKNSFASWGDDLDSIPFPARDLMKNDLYMRPDVNRPMATIQTSRGCPSRCIYCLSPKISGRCVRFRSPKNVFDEILECYEKYNIKDFFFKADTFTINKKWTLELCNLIKNSKLNGKIHYTANSRVKPIDEELLIALKETGCFTIAFGFETGSAETMEKIKKGVTLEDNLRAMKLAKKVGIPVFGFFMIGFPWEEKKHIEETKKMIFKLNPDFLELHIALPYYGSEFYDLCKEENVLNENVVGTDYFHSSTKGTKYITNKELLSFRKKVLLLYHIRPSYIIKKLLQSGLNPVIIGNYFKFGMRLIINIFKRN